jgi:hypothetical protein
MGSKNNISLFALGFASNNNSVGGSGSVTVNMCSNLNLDNIFSL